MDLTPKAARAGPEPVKPGIHGVRRAPEPGETRDSRCQDAVKPGFHGVPRPAEPGQTGLAAALAARRRVRRRARIRNDPRLPISAGRRAY